MADIIIGRNAVLEALRALRFISKVLMEQGQGSDAKLVEIERLSAASGVSLERVPRHALDAAAGQRAHQGVVAFAQPRRSPTLEDLGAESAQKDETPLYVVLDGIEDPHNLGAILRTCDATGVHAVITRSRRSVGLTPAAAKAAAGAAEYVPLLQVANIAQSLEALKKKGIWIVGIEGAAVRTYLSVDYRPPTAVVVGGEGKGISALVRRRCDFLASIPMKGKITSLNASVAAAVVLYEVVRQRTSTDPR